MLHATDDVTHEATVSAADFNVFPESGQWGLCLRHAEISTRAATLAALLSVPPRAHVAHVFSPALGAHDDTPSPPVVGATDVYGHVSSREPLSAWSTASAGTVGGEGAGAGQGAVPVWSNSVLQQPVHFPDPEKFLHVGMFVVEECPVPVVVFPAPSPGAHSGSRVPVFDSSVIDMFGSGT